MIYDHTGLPVTAISQESADAFDAALISYLRFGKDIGDKLKAVFSIDKNMFMANILRGYFMHMMGIRKLVPKAEQALETAKLHKGLISKREEYHLKALESWCRLDLQGATNAWEESTQLFPEDALGLKMLHYTHFYMGNSEKLKKSIDKVWSTWKERKDLPTYGYILSLKAFGLEEIGEYESAEIYAREAAELNNDDAWAVHCVAHVCEMQKRTKDGIQWLNQNLDNNNWNNFKYHLIWHKTLMLIEEKLFDEALDLYDQSIFDPESDEYLDLANSISLLSRLELSGINVSDRWVDLNNKIKNRLNDQLLNFVDAHFMLGIASSDIKLAESFLESIQNYNENNNDTYSNISQRVGYALCDSILNYKKNNFVQCVKILEPILDDIRYIGGSNAQRDIFELLFIDASLKTNNLNLSHKYIDRKFSINPNNMTLKHIVDKY